MLDTSDTSEPQKSFAGRCWKLHAPAAGDIAALRATGIGEHVATLMAARGIAPGEAADFLDPKIKNLMPDPYVLLDMEKGAERIAKAITGRERIGIWSDYDADGANSAAVLGWFLRLVGHDDFVLRIPDRIKEGYGPNGPGLLRMKDEEGCSLVCVLDAGIVAFKPLLEAGMPGWRSWSSTTTCRPMRRPWNRCSWMKSSSPGRSRIRTPTIPSRWHMP